MKERMIVQILAVKQVFTLQGLCLYLSQGLPTKSLLIKISTFAGLLYRISRVSRRENFEIEVVF